MWCAEFPTTTGAIAHASGSGAHNLARVSGPRRAGDDHHAGTFRFGTRLVYLACALTNQRIGVEETDDGLWSICFHTVLLATFDERDCIIQS
jgi:hypothetical protein